MDKSKRIFYKPAGVTLNGVAVHGITNVGMTTEFELCQCFCSCPLPLAAMGDEFSWPTLYLANCDRWLEVHYDNCPNAKQERLLRHVMQAEIEQYKALGW